jgi:hypothetical protein
MNTRIILHAFLAFFLISFAIPFESLAQSTSANNRSSRGRDFYMTFMPNVHDNRQGGITDTLYLYITSDVATSGVIRYRNRNRQVFSQPFSITNPNQVYIHRIYYRDVELQGYFSGSGDVITFANSQSERVAPQYVRVTANDDVTVYGLNQAYFTSDAFLALPVSALGTEYLVMAYKSDARGQNFTTSDRDETSTPSEFAIVATQDATDVVIRPTDPVLFGGTIATLRVRLNEGESYLVQADPRTREGLADLTGSRIIATKPISVFGGHQRTTLPVEFKPSLASRDHLVEQMPGLETWGKRAFITPLQRSSNEIEVGTNLYRVLAAYDTTRVFLNGQPLATLNAGQYYEGQLTASGVITASDVILVAQFKKTSGAGNLIGDPFMLLVPTVEQYDRTYRFVNAEVTDRIANVPPSGIVFSEHFVTVVAPTNSLGSLRLDGQPIATSNFQAISGSAYSFANLSVRGGVHTALGDSAFAIYVYGYGLMNSYGYVGGGRLRIIAPDRDAPALIARDTCFGVNGTVYDTLLTDSRIASVQALTPRNVNVTITPFTPFADSVRFRATLQNTLLDGEFTLEAKDSAGFVTRRRFVIPGFTIALEGQNASAQAPSLRFTLDSGRSRTFRVPIVNYGTTTQTLTSITLQNAAANPAPMRLLSPSVPLTLPPGARDTVVIALDAVQNGMYSATLTFGNACAVRQVAQILAEAGKDRTPPDTSSVRDVCARRVTLRIQDAEPFPSGLSGIEILSPPVNCTLTISPQSAPSSVTTPREILITILNPRLDAVYALALTDSAGNRTIVRDTVQGFTLQIVRTMNERGGTGSWGNVPITSLDCQSVEIRNVGIKPYRLERLVPRGNRWFSMSESQFPLTIAAGGSSTLRVCFAPLEEANYTDSLVIEGYCLQEVLVLSGHGTPLIRTDTSRCNAIVQLRTARAPLNYFMEQNYPNPASGGQTTLKIGMVEASPVTLTIFSMMGIEIDRLSLGTLQAGEHEVVLDVTSLKPGIYWYQIQTSQTRMTRQFSVSY